MVLINGLPEGSALHRAQMEGHEWTTQHSLMWEIIHQLAELNQISSRQLNKRQGRGLKPIKWKKFPWSKDTTDAKRHGSVNPGDQAAAVSYLTGMVES